MQILFERYLYEIPNVNSIKLHWDAKQGTSVCSRIKRLTSNRAKNRKRAFENEKSDDKGAVAIVKTVPQLGCASQDFELSELPKSVKHRGNPRRGVLGSIRRVRFRQSTLRQASIRENKGPSLGQIQVKISHQRSPYGVNFEDRSQEETERQERCARCKAWTLARHIYKLKEKDKTTFCSLTECRPHPPLKKNQGKRVCGRLREQVCKWSARESLTLLSWRP